MDFSSLLTSLKNLDTNAIAKYFRAINVGEIIQNPKVLIAIGVIALIALIMKWRLLLATILTVTGLAALVNYTVQKGTTLDNLGNENLVLFVCIGVGIIFVAIYLVFIKNE